MRELVCNTPAPAAATCSAPTAALRRAQSEWAAVLRALRRAGGHAAHPVRRRRRPCVHRAHQREAAAEFWQNGAPPPALDPTRCLHRMLSGAAWPLLAPPLHAAGRPKHRAAVRRAGAGGRPQWRLLPRGQPHALRAGLAAGRRHPGAGPSHDLPRRCGDGGWPMREAWLVSLRHVCRRPPDPRACSPPVVPAAPDCAQVPTNLYCSYCHPVGGNPLLCVASGGRLCRTVVQASRRVVAWSAAASSPVQLGRQYRLQSGIPLTCLGLLRCRGLALC